MGDRVYPRFQDMPCAAKRALQEFYGTLGDEGIRELVCTFRAVRVETQSLFKETLYGNELDGKASRPRGDALHYHGQ
jgi:hypothetical protein